MDLMDEGNIQESMADSISCLHAIEHFGLGRYGDQIDPEGHIKGFKNMIKMLKPKGKLYISFPICKTNQVHFNAHRVFHPQDILSWLDNANQIKLDRFDYVDESGSLNQKSDVYSTGAGLEHGCGIYTFIKQE
jgi:predicted SAM-dependent methyltransferase